MLFYPFDQNNSYGRFDVGDNLGHTIFIEAFDADSANRLAEVLGLYFDGAGDCPCCGDRWAATHEAAGLGSPFDHYAFTGTHCYPSKRTLVVHYADGTKTVHNVTS